MMHRLDPGPGFTRSDIVALGATGPYRLTIHHAQGVIVEYFSTTKDALRRQGDLEHLLNAAQGFAPPVTTSGTR